METNNNVFYYLVDLTLKLFLSLLICCTPQISSAQLADSSRISNQVQNLQLWQQKWDSMQTTHSGSTATNGDNQPTHFGQKLHSLSSPIILQADDFDSLSTISKLKDKTDQLSTTPQIGLPEVDSLIQLKTQVLRQKILNLEGKSTKLDSIQNALPLKNKLGKQELDQYSHELDQLIDLNVTKITDLQEQAWVSNYTSQLDQIDGVLGKYSGRTVNIDELGQLKGLQRQLGAIRQESNLYFKDGQGLLNGMGDDNTLMQFLEQKVGHRMEFQELKQQMAVVDNIEEHKQQLSQPQLRQQMLAKAKSIGAQQFAGRQDLLKAAQEKLAKYKRKYVTVHSTNDMSTAVKRNSLAGEPLSERLMLGGTFQIIPAYSKQQQPASPAGRQQHTGNNSNSAYSNNSGDSKVPTSVDISPLLGYRINKKLTVGVGGTYRAILEIDDLKRKDQVYGYRGFIQQHAIKGFFVHGEYENLNTASLTTDSGDKVNRSWQPAGLAGIGREFNFFKHAKGQVMFLYNFLHEDGASPYRKPWMIRFGFNLQGLQSKEPSTGRDTE